MAENTDLTKLSKKDLMKMYIYSQAFCKRGFNYENRKLCIFHDAGNRKSIQK